MNIHNFRSSIDPEQLPNDWLLERLRIERNRLLAASDWAMASDAPTDKTAWGKYRQALRDLPNGWVPKEIVEMPELPT
jgi:hypothetical protein